MLIIGWQLKRYSAEVLPSVAKARRYITRNMGRLGVAQMCSTDDKEYNFHQTKKLVSEAQGQQVELLSLPECFAFMGASGDCSKRAGENINGALMQRYLGLAREHCMWLSLGGFHERSKDVDGRVWNTHVLADDNGRIRGIYRKSHLFDVDAGTDGAFNESRTTIAGDVGGVVCLNTPVGAVGLTTCYDVRFPYLYWSLRSAGADVMLVPSAFMRSTGHAHWEMLLRARAIETQCYIAAAAQCGTHNQNRSSYGHSMIVDCWGSVQADVGGESEHAVIVTDIDHAFIQQTRRRMPIAQHRRPHIAAVQICD